MASFILDQRELTAVRDVRLDGLEVNEGQIIGLLDGELVAAGSDVDDVVMELMQRLDADEAEILTLYYGETISESIAQGLVDQLETHYPDAEIEVINGGQPHYHYIISAE